ncbi:MAG: heme o synthase [Pyrobaculum sp.]
MSPYIVLLKPRVIWLLVLAALAGYIYASPTIDLVHLLYLTLVAFLSTGGSAAFNHYWERDIDSLMTRTAKRPLPTGSVTPSSALVYSLALSTIGIGLGFALLPPLSAAFVALGWAFYSIIYTILLKRRTWLNIIIGGFAGNATFLGGYALGRGTIDLEAVLLSFIIYLWIPAHIWSLAYKYRDEYRKTGVPMLPALVKEETSIVLISILNIASAIYAVFLYLYFVGVAYSIVLVAAAAAAALVTSIYALVKKTDDAMWKMFKATSPTLALFLLALILTR